MHRSCYYLNRMPTYLLKKNRLTFHKIDVASRQSQKNMFKNIFKFATSEQNIRSLQQSPTTTAIRNQPWYQQYITATNYFTKEQNFQQSLAHYYKVIQIMEQKNQKGQAYYYKIYEKILQLNFLLNRPLETEQNLYKLIRTKKQLNKNPILVYEDYKNLMIHQIQNNVQKAIKLGKALLSQSQINNLPINIEKSIRMLLGNGYALMGNYPDAKKKYGQVLEMKPNHKLKGITLNNLAVACWWHKNPLFRQSFSESPELNYEEVRINRDFKQTKQLLMNSIGSLQGIEQLQQKQGVALENLLNEITQTMVLSGSSSSSKRQSSSQELSYVFREKCSLKSIYNLIQYYIYNDPIQKPLILAWMRVLIKNAAKWSSIQTIEQITAKYYLLNSDTKSLKSFLISIIQGKKVIEEIIKNPRNIRTTRDLKEKVHYLQLLKMANMVKEVTYTPEQKQNTNNSSPSKQPQLVNQITPSIIRQLQTSLLQTDPFIMKRQFFLSEQLSFMTSYYEKVYNQKQ